MNHVFISYRHESEVHAKKVRDLAESLKIAGLPVALDQFYLGDNPGGPDGGWPRWCIDNAKKSACVLIVCSKGWFEAAQSQGPSGKGLGVAAEAWIFLAQLYQDKLQNARIRLVILDDFNEAQIPLELSGWQVFKPSSAPEQADQMQRWIRQRLAMPSSSGSQAAKVVYLVENKYDLRVERKNLADSLVGAGWEIRPDPKSPQPIEDDLRESLAFVQLLESFPRDDQSHHTQFEQAQKLMPCFRFRHSKIRVDEADEPHRTFLKQKGIIPGGFDDFKMNLVKNDLEAIWNQKLAPAAYASRDILVRVAIRSANPEPIWDEVFSWVDKEPGMRSALLEGSESFKEKHDPAVPCHGFLIVCDNAVQEGLVSSKTDLEQCMQIQVGERSETRRPPVAVVFWPPPDPKWPRLVRVTPPKLYRIVANAPDELKAFFQEVRKVAA